MLGQLLGDRFDRLWFTGLLKSTPVDSIQLSYAEDELLSSPSRPIQELRFGDGRLPRLQAVQVLEGASVVDGTCVIDVGRSTWSEAKPWVPPPIGLIVETWLKLRDVTCCRSDFQTCMSSPGTPKIKSTET